MNKGKIVQVMGPVVDVEFENNDIPYIFSISKNRKSLPIFQFHQIHLSY